MHSWQFNARDGISINANLAIAVKSTFIIARI